MAIDLLGRPLGSLRISVTDRCNLRCRYCMPEKSYRWLPRRDLLTFEEIRRVAAVFRGLGVDRVRITGGEPLLRRDLPQLIRLLAELDWQDFSMTTNGLLLADMARDLKEAGLRRVTVSLDSLHFEGYREMAQSGNLAEVLHGLDVAQREFAQLKIDTVLLRGRNDHEIGELLRFAHQRGAELRFIEYMDVGGATHWDPAEVVSRQQILDLVSELYGEVVPLEGRGAAPAERFRLPHGQIFGVIASVTRPFCRDCDRARLTADGHFLLCLYARHGLDLRQALRDGANDSQLADLIRQAWRARSDRGAEERASRPLRERLDLVPVEALRQDPRLEMHTRGG